MSLLTVFEQQNEDRFWIKVSSGEPDACWEWKAYRNRDGYGVFTIQGKNYLAHRIAWLLLTGVEPGQMNVCHTCDNPSCCNVRHLWLGTHRQNMEDCAKKRRTCSGERHGASKLTLAEICEIRTSDETLKELSEQYGVSFQQISRIKHQERWTNLPVITR